MKNTWLVLGGLFLASIAQADFSGTWVGSGTLTNPEINLQCTRATIVVHQSATELDVPTVDFECQQASLQENPMTLTIQNGMDLMYQGQKVGMIMDNAIDASFTSPGAQGGQGGTTSWHVTVSGDQMNFLEKSIGNDGNGWTITATLKRQ